MIFVVDLVIKLASFCDMHSSYLIQFNSIQMFLEKAEHLNVQTSLI